MRTPPLKLADSPTPRTSRLARPALVFVLGLAVLAPATASAEEGGDAQTELAERRPPPAYRPGPPAYRPVRPYRPAPRRVYVVPTYAPRPRRVAEIAYNPMFHFGVGVNGTSVLSADGSQLTDGLDSGAGFEMSFGWRLAPRFSLDFTWLMSFHDAAVGAAGPEAALTSLSVDGRFFLVDRSRQTQPYVQLGVGAYILGTDSWDFNALTGAGFQLGGGVDFYLSRYVSIGAKVLYRGAYLDNAESTWSQFPTESTWLSAVTYGGDLKFHF